MRELEFERVVKHMLGLRLSSGEAHAWAALVNGGGEREKGKERERVSAGGEARARATLVSGEYERENERQRAR